MGTENKIKFWFVGLPLIVDGVEKGWMPEGVYLTEDEAINNTNENEFIVCFDVGCRLPINAEDSEVFYYPKLEKWEDSKLYRMRNKL